MAIHFYYGEGMAVARHLPNIAHLAKFQYEYGWPDPRENNGCNVMMLTDIGVQVAWFEFVLCPNSKIRDP